MLRSIFHSLFKGPNVDAKIILGASQLASLMTLGVQLVQEIDAIRQQTAENAPDVWKQTTDEFAGAVAAFDAAVEATGHYHDARARTVESAETSQLSPELHAGEPVAGAIGN